MMFAGILQLKPHPRMSMALEGHGFWLADTHDNFYNAAGAPRGGVTTTTGMATASTRPTAALSARSWT